MFLGMNNTRLEWKILIILDFENGFLPTYLPHSAPDGLLWMNLYKLQKIQRRILEIDSNISVHEQIKEISTALNDEVIYL